MTPVRHLAPLLLLALTGLGTSCSVTPPAEVNALYKQVLEQRHSHYALKDGDKIDIKLYNREGDLNQEDVLILPDGRSDVFFMDNFRFQGKTIAEMEAELKARIVSEVRDVEISIQVEPAGEVVYLVGQFEKPDVVALRTRMTLQEAISKAGGLRITGDTDWALLRRPYFDPRNPDLFRIDLNDESEDIFLLPGDQIVLGRNFLAAVVAYVREYIFGIFPGAQTIGPAAIAATL